MKRIGHLNLKHIKAGAFPHLTKQTPSKLPQVRYHFWQGDEPEQGLACIVVAGPKTKRERMWAQIMSQIGNIDVEQDYEGKVKRKDYDWRWEAKAGPVRVHQLDWSTVGPARLNQREVNPDPKLETHYNEGTLESYLSALFG